MSTATEAPPQELAINPLQIQADTLAKLKSPLELGARACFRGEDATSNPFHHEMEREQWKVWGKGYQDAMQLKILLGWKAEEEANTPR